MQGRRLVRMIALAFALAAGLVATPRAGFAECPDRPVKLRTWNSPW